MHLYGLSSNNDIAGSLCAAISAASSVSSPRPVLVADFLVPPLSLLLIFVHPVLLLLPVFALLPLSFRYPALLLLHLSPEARTFVSLRFSGQWS